MVTYIQFMGFELSSVVETGKIALWPTLIAIFVYFLRLRLKDLGAIEDAQTHNKKLKDDYQAFIDRLKWPHPFTTAYQTYLRRFLDWTDRFYGGQRRIDGRPHPYAPEAFDCSLFLAILYPLLCVYVLWLWGIDTDVSRLLDIGSIEGEREQFQAIFLTVLVGISTWLVNSLSGWKTILAFVWFWLCAAAALLIGVPAIMIVFIVVTICAYTMRTAFSGIFLGSYALFITLFFAAINFDALTYTLVENHVMMYIIAFFGSVVFIIAFGATTFLLGRFLGARGHLTYIVSCLYTVLAFGAVFWAVRIRPDIDPTDLSLLLVFILIPAVNALFDFGSTGLTRALLRRNLAAGAAWWQRLGLAGVDFFIALLLLIGLSVSLFWMISAFNATAMAAGLSGPVLDISALVCDIDRAPSSPQLYWIYFTLLTTLIPTALHGCIALLSAGEAMMARSHDALGLAGEPEQRSHTHKVMLAILWVGEWPMRFLCIGAGVWGLFMLWHLMPGLAQSLLNVGMLLTVGTCA